MDIELQELHEFNPIDFERVFRELREEQPSLGVLLRGDSLKLSEEDVQLTVSITSKMLENCLLSIRDEEEYARECQLRQREKKRLLKRQKRKLVKKDELQPEDASVALLKSYDEELGDWTKPLEEEAHPSQHEGGMLQSRSAATSVNNPSGSHFSVTTAPSSEEEMKHGMVVSQ